MRVAIDVGGTFTDVLLHDPGSGSLWSAKVSSDPTNPAGPFWNGLERILNNAKVGISQVEHLVHGTTVVTNALFEGKTAKTGLLVTRGFGDILEIGRQQRPNLYDLMADQPPPLVPRSRVAEVIERLGADGQILTPLDEGDGQNQLHALHEAGIESLAIVLLFSFKNSTHERKLVELAHKLLPGVLVFPSHQILAEFREYERASTTVIAAAVAPRVVSYIQSIERRLQNYGEIGDRLMIMHSGGGTMPASEAALRPHTLVESGPAAGLTAASYLAKNLGLPQVIAFDMGGTTAKAGLVLDGLPKFSAEYEVGGEVHVTGSGLGSGYPLRSPMIDLIECGAGAGSIARVDSGGHLKVGPLSAGANPGPACYDQGGIEPTVTDAHLLLGRLAPHAFLGGELPLRLDLAEQAIAGRIAEKMNIGLEQTAAGILAIVNANMLRILRILTVSRGHDPRDFTLLAYGGAGPLHATELAADLGISQVIVPCYPGLFSALGLLYANMTNTFLETVMKPLSVDFLADINAALTRLASSAEAWFDRNQVDPQERRLRVSADLRYRRQNYELNLLFPGKFISVEDFSAIAELFHQEHKLVYGHSAPGELIQVVNIHIQASREVKAPMLPQVASASRSVEDARLENRKVWFSRGLMECGIYDRAKLKNGHLLDGPAIVQEVESTTLVDLGWQLRVDKFGNLVITSHS
jgi:N-methylhydantoinase A